MTNFDKDLFISYAHIDNQPLTPDEKGWITRFHMSLEAMLNMRMGGLSRIWRDDKLQGNDVFADEIVNQFANTAIIVSILTPRYLNSEWCTREVTEFCMSAEKNGGIVVENKARIFKVLKTPVETQDSLPEVAKDVLGYEFFTIEDGAPLELDAAYGEKFAQDYNRKVGTLAWDISQLLKTLATDAGKGVGGDRSNKSTVFLAECSYDRKQDREVLEGELKHHGYKVLPDQQLPRDEAEYVAAVDGFLKRSKLSIHLVGNSYGSVPDGPSQKSATILQNEIAARMCGNGGLKRVIWLPGGTVSDQPQQQEFIDLLHRDASAQIGADLITGDLEDLKSSVHATLAKLEEPEPKVQGNVAQTTDASRAKLVYLICDQKDRKATIPVRKFLRSRGAQDKIPVFEGGSAAIREAHQNLLADCDAVILFYGAGDEAWKRTIENDLKKMAAYRSGKSLPPVFTYLADPITTDKEEMIDFEEPNLINGLGDFSENEMAELIDALKVD